VDAFFERMAMRAATIDELLSDAFEPVPDQHGDADLAGRRLAAWRQACAAADPSLFERRLERDRLSIGRVMERFGAVRRAGSAAAPAWIGDAIWIEAALRDPSDNSNAKPGKDSSEPCVYGHLFAALIEQADARVWSGLEARVRDTLSGAARAARRHALLEDISGLCAAPLYERFVQARKAGADPAGAAQPPANGTAHYDRFVADMQAGGFRRLFEDKPVLLRLVATLTRQWIDASREFARRLDEDLPAIRRDLLDSHTAGAVEAIEGDVSDPHNGGRSVQILTFEDGSRVVYKPKDLRLDVAWHEMIERLNAANPPVALRAPRAIARDGYGWSEFIAHARGTDRDGSTRFFRRAGAWLALLHCCAATDMHQENIIAAGDHPVPIDLETILQQTADEHKAQDAEGAAFDAAMDIIANSVMTVGLLPAYGRSVDNSVFAMGGVAADWGARVVIKWNDINSDAMTPARAQEAGTSNSNLPHVDGRYAKFGDHIDSFASGFADYARFLLHLDRGTKAGLFAGFAGLPVRRVIRPTRFYYMLLQRLKNHRSMDDGATWSAQADFIARLSEWDKADALWPLLRAERAALVALNVPHFVAPSDGSEISDADGTTVRTHATPGLQRAQERLQNLDERDIAWQVEVIRENANPLADPASDASVPTRSQSVSLPDIIALPAKQEFAAEADRIAVELEGYAIRRGPSAAWIGLDWLGDSDSVQLVCLGPDLYNGVCGIALFLAAHAGSSGRKTSAELARAAIAYLRHNLKSRNAARMARALGIGGATGLGSIVYALCVIAKCLGDDDILADAEAAAGLCTDALIAADKQLDVMGGSAGAILGLLRLYRDTGLAAALGRAAKCGEHLLAQRRDGAAGSSSFIGQGLGPHALNGMSHGAAGFAYALASLAAATGRDEFAQAATECMMFEDASYDAQRQNWPDLRVAGQPLWPCRWCHGAAGIGLARLATVRHGGINAERDAALLAADIGNAVAGVERSWPGSLDTLCCGTLGNVEFLCEAATALERGDLRERGARHLMAVMQRAAAAGDYRWNSGKRQFNLGLFRGLAGVGYTALRQVDGTLPNVLIWE
jgi:type 2 lantibiotic biosynthesis protein LanM